MHIRVCVCVCVCVCVQIFKDLANFIQFVNSNKMVVSMSETKLADFFIQGFRTFVFIFILRFITFPAGHIA